MKTALGLSLIGVVAVAVVLGAYDLTRISTEYSADGRPFVRMVTGPAGGTWYPLGAKMSQVFAEEIPEILAASGPGGGIENVRDVNQRNAEIGFSLSDVAYEGYHGTGMFRHEQSNVRHLATAYTNVLQLAVPRRSSLRGIADLKDKNISPGKAGWAATEMVRTVLAQYGLSFESIRRNGGTVHNVDYSDSVALMKDGHIDAFFALTAVPQASLMELDFEPGIRLIGLDDEVLEKVLRLRPGYIQVTIPRGTYAHQEEDVRTLGVPVVVIVHKDVPDDLVYRLTKVFWARHRDFVGVSPVWNEVKLENALLAASVPVHPGAQRFYDQAGVALGQ